MTKAIYSPKQVGTYRFYDFCRFCYSKDVSIILDLGYMPLAGGFLKNLSKKIRDEERFFPLQLIFCQKCFLVQTNVVINANTLFKDYFYFSSKIQTLVDHFSTIAEEIPHMVTNKKNAFIVEIGSNDGSFIQAVQKKGYKTLGVDPATNVVTPLIKKGLPIINDYFTQKVANNIVSKFGQADGIYSFNTLAHIEDMHDVFSAISKLLKKDGYLIFETHYLGKLLDEAQYDMIYHEHQYYYSLLTMENFLSMHNMEIFDVQLVSTHAGSIRFSVQKSTGKRKISPNVSRLKELEKKKQLNKLETYQHFSEKIADTKKQLLALLTKLKRKQHTIVGYGASGRGTIIMNYCGLDTSLLTYVVDDAKAKQDIYIPGVHVSTFSSDKLYGKNKPDYTLLFAWSFIDEIKKTHQKYLENGGKFIVPLPNVAIIEK